MHKLRQLLNKRWSRKSIEVSVVSTVPWV
jgi:hypothetical protein